MANIESVIGYFRHQCETHPDLLHSETPGQRVFEVSKWEEAWGDFRTDIREKGYAVRLVMPEFTLDNLDGCAARQYDVLFFVGKYAKPRTGAKADYYDALADCERVALDFVSKMVADSRAGHPLFNHTGETVADMNVKGEFIHQFGDGSYVAVMMSLTFANIVHVTTAGVAWTDGGLTPNP